MLLTPRDADAFPSALGALKRPDPTPPPGVCDLKPVPGRLFLLVDGLGRMTYAPPIPPKEGEKPKAEAKPDTPPVEGLTLEDVRRLGLGAEVATHRSRTGTLYVRSRDGRNLYWSRSSDAWGQGDMSWAELVEMFGLVPIEKPASRAEPLPFTTIPHTDPAAKDVPWSELGATPPAGFKGWLESTKGHASGYFRYWDGTCWLGEGWIATLLHEHPVASLKPSPYNAVISFRPIHPVL
jgi:hypothetical protein